MMGVVKLFLILTIFTDSVNSRQLSSLCFLHNENDTYSDICEEESQKLSCGPDEVIMINDIQYTKKTKPESMKCAYCSNDARSDVTDWDIDLTQFKTRLYQTCSKKSGCKFNSTVKIPNQERGSQYIWFAKISYNCTAKGLFEDMCSSWRKTTDSLHISLTNNNFIPRHCSCIIEEDLGYLNITVIDYRPYYSDVYCANSSVFVDDDERFQCWKNGTDSSVYNRPISKTNNRINVTVLIGSNIPEDFWMFWIHVEGFNVSVQCNSNMSTSTTTTTTMTMTKPPPPPTTTTAAASAAATATTTAAAAQTTLSTSLQSETVPEQTTIIPSLSYDDSSEDSISVTSTIAGASTGLIVLLVLIAIIIYIVYRRRLNRPTRTKNKENIYADVHDKENKRKKSKTKNGIINMSYENGCEEINITFRSSENIQKVENNVYSEPADAAVDDIYTEPVETEGNIQISNTRKNAEPVHNYQEPYDTTLLIRDNDRIPNYTKVVKGGEKKDVYNTLSEIDNYSHIHILTDVSKSVDNYSHIKLGQGQESAINYGRSTDMYSHIKVDSIQQEVSDNVKCQPIKGDNTFEETEEYDHLTHYSNH